MAVRGAPPDKDVSADAAKARGVQIAYGDARRNFYLKLSKSIFVEYLVTPLPFIAGYGSGEVRVFDSVELRVSVESNEDLFGKRFASAASNVIGAFYFAAIDEIGECFLNRSRDITPRQLLVHRLAFLILSRA